MNKKLITLLFILAGTMILAISCCRTEKNAEGSEAIKAADRYYSDMSAQKGMNAAFLEMFADSGVILRRNHMPVEGISAIRSLLVQEEDTSFTLTWEPVRAEVAESGELGYSYGTYKIVSKSSNAQMSDGTYATVWKKDAGGEWHAVLDTGNPGLKSPAESK